MRLWTTGDRLAALKAYDILDTPPEAGFEDIVEIARTLTGAPIALVSLLDADRQWFKAERGAGFRETPLDASFCKLAIDDDADTLVIPDTVADARTRDMPSVTDPPHVRSYAGVVLRTPQGVPVGTVCVLDVEPRDYPATVVESLTALARQVVAQLEVRRAAAERVEAAASLRDSNLGRELAMQAARLGRWDHRPHLGGRFYDARAREILRLPETGDISLPSVLELMDPRDLPAVEEAMDAVMRPERVGPYDVQFRMAEDGRWVSCVGRTQFENGVCVRFFGVVEDITERRRMEEQSAFLTQELNHRVKNILALAQAVADSTLRTAPGLPEAREVLAARLQALGRAHDLLLRRRWEAADLREVAVATLDASGADMRRLEVEGPPLELGSRPALQLALALHELATNALKYGAFANDTGRAALRWSVEPDGDGGAPRLHLGWTERGGPPVSPPGRPGFGSRVIGPATEAAFGGRVTIEPATAGLRWSLTAPLAGLADARGEGGQPGTQANR